LKKSRANWSSLWLPSVKMRIIDHCCLNRSRPQDALSPDINPMVEWIFWDNDGVLVETEHLYFQACAAALARTGTTLTLSDYCELSLRRGESVLTLANRQGCSEPEVAELRALRDRHYLELLDAGVPAIPGVRETLDRLAGRVRMGIVTSCRGEHFRRMHRRNGLLDYFEFVLVREDYQRSKPHPEPYRKALQRAGQAPDRCLAVEDSERGVLSATGAGLPCVAIPGPLTIGGDFRRARWRLGGVRELLPLLDRD
jgi:HAD superfamily hydrolase (TIGR01509 family)